MFCVQAVSRRENAVLTFFILCDIIKIHKGGNMVKSLNKFFLVKISVT